MSEQTSPEFNNQRVSDWEFACRIKYGSVRDYLTAKAYIEDSLNMQQIAHIFGEGEASFMVMMSCPNMARRHALEYGVSVIWNSLEDAGFKDFTFNAAKMVETEVARAAQANDGDVPFRDITAEAQAVERSIKASQTLEITDFM